jgi:UDP-2-acetamido-3-amino-2,3-dideoxy-glucuronate N-acetyltransferase
MSYFKHESAYVDENCEIGEGTKIWHFCHIQSNSKIGEKCVFGQNVNVGNNVRMVISVKFRTMSLFMRELSLKIMFFAVLQWFLQT